MNTAPLCDLVTDDSDIADDMTRTNRALLYTQMSGNFESNRKLYNSQ